MGLNKIVSMILHAGSLILFHLPVVATAAEIPWLSTNYSSISQIIENEYSVDGQQKIYYGEDYKAEPTFTASEVSFDQKGLSSSQTTASTLQVSTSTVENVGERELISYAGSTFTGSFIGSVKPLKLSYTIQGENRVDYTVIDKTTSRTVYYERLRGSKEITVATPVDHEMVVTLSVESFSSSSDRISPPYHPFGEQGPQRESVRLDYLVSRE